MFYICLYIYNIYASFMFFIEKQPEEVKVSQKDWILQYAVGASDDEGASEEETEPDPVSGSTVICNMYH